MSRCGEHTAGPLACVRTQPYLNQSASSPILSTLFLGGHHTLGYHQQIFPVPIMASSQGGNGFSLRFTHQPSDRPTSQTAGKVLEPQIIVEMTGTIADRRYIAYAYGCSGTETAGKPSGDEISGTTRTGPGGSVSFEFGDLRIANPGTHSIRVSVLEENSTASGYDECAQILTAPINVS